MATTASFKADEYRSLPTGSGVPASKYAGPENNGIDEKNLAGTIQTGENPVPDETAVPIAPEASAQDVENAENAEQTEAEAFDPTTGTEDGETHLIADADVEGETEAEAEAPTPDSSWTVAEIDAWAADREIELTGTKKQKLAQLAALEEGTD